MNKRRLVGRECQRWDGGCWKVTDEGNSGCIFVQLCLRQRCGGQLLGECDSTECYLPSTMQREGKLILHFPVSPFHKYDTLIFIIPHALSFWKEITGDSLFSLHHIFQLGSPLLQIISFLLPEALLQSSSHSIGILFSLHFRKKCKLKNNYIFNDRLILLY